MKWEVKGWEKIHKQFFSYSKMNKTNGLDVFFFFYSLIALRALLKANKSDKKIT